MSEYTRRSNIVWNDHCKCVTCSTLKHWKEIHAGHFIHCSRGSLASYNPKNIHPQCNKCNTYLGGNLIEYTLFIQNTYGNETIDDLKAEKQTIMKRADFDRVIEELREKLMTYKII